MFFCSVFIAFRCAQTASPVKLITLKPIKVFTQINVKDADVKDTQFMQIKTSRDGKPVGIVVKRRKSGKNKRQRDIDSDEIIEIIGKRDRDTSDDEKNLYR